MLDDSFYADVVGTLVPEDFSLESHRRILKRMGGVHERGERIDRVTVANELMKFSELESIGNLTYLISLDDGLPQVPSLESYIRIVKDKAILRQVIFTAQNLAQRAMSGASASEVLDLFGQQAVKLSDIASVAGAQPFSTADMIAERGVDALLSPRRHGEVRLPWHRLNNALSGVAGGQIIVLLGETSRGKTSLALQAGTHVSQQGKTVLIWTLEMSPYSLFRRMVNQLSGIPVGNRPTGQLSFEERDRHRMAVAHLADNPIYFDRHSRSVTSFCASIRRVAAKAKIGLVIVDYLQLIRSQVAQGTRAQQVAENSRNLKLAAMDFNLPIFVLSQVDRSSVKGKDAKIGLHSAKESGDIENDADVQLAIQAPQLARDEDTPCEIEVQKQREGACGFSIPMVFRPTSQTFMETQDVD